MPSQLPSQHSPRASDELLVQVAPLRGQAAIVRTLLDHLEDCAPRAGALPSTRDQLVEELARLGRRIVETAAALAREPEGAFVPAPAASPRSTR